MRQEAGYRVLFFRPTRINRFDIERVPDKYKAGMCDYAPFIFNQIVSYA